MDKDTRNNDTGMVLTSLFIITICLVVVILVVSFFGMNVSSGDRSVDVLKSDWSVTDGVQSKKITLPGYINLTKPETLVISHKLPVDISDQDVLMIPVEHQNISVTIDDILLCEYESEGVLSEFCGNSYQFVALNREMAGKSVKIIYRVSDAVSETHVSAPVIGGSGALFSYVLKNNIFVLIGGSFLFLAGNILVVLAVVFKLKKLKIPTGQTALMGMFLICISLWQLINSGIMQMIGERESFTYLLDYESRMLMPVALVWYFASRFNYRYKLLEYICWVGLLNTVVSTVVFILGVADLYVFAIAQQIIIILSGVVLLYTLLTERIKLGLFKLKLPIFGSFILVVSGMLDIIRNYVTGREIIAAAGNTGFILAAFLMLAAYVVNAIYQKSL